MCHSPTGYGLKTTFGTSAGTQDFDSVEQADVIMVIGANPTDGHPVFASHMKRRLREGAKLIVIDPRRIDLVRMPHVEADYHLPLRPGTNVAMINAMAHVIVTEGLVNEAIRARALRLGRFEQWRQFIARTAQLVRKRGEDLPACPPQTSARAARLYATGGNAAIYYGLGVTEHSQGSTMVMGMANLAMATGNIGRPGVGVNPLRGQNNVQGACDMGSFPHEFSGYRHVSDDATRAMFEEAWGVRSMPNRVCASPTCWTRPSKALQGLYVQGEDIVQSDPNTQHVTAGLAAMECVVVQDLFLNETASYAHVFLPGSSFLEKDGTFTNAERRIQRVRKVMPPWPATADWEITMALSNAWAIR